MIDPKHPRAESLKIRDRIVDGVKKGITSTHGLIAQGRGEAFDYLIGEQTQDFAQNAIEAAASMLLTAKHPVLSVNGNSAALVPQEYIALANILNCPIEINLFHSSLERKQKIRDYLIKFGAQNITGIDDLVEIYGIASARKNVSPEGIAKADVVFVPLEDGDRTEALIKANKKVITVDLNPLSRTAQKASITIVDNIVRVMPELIKIISSLKENAEKQKQILDQYDNKTNLKTAVRYIVNNYL